MASIPVDGTCATLAAQVAHTAFYLEVLERSLRSGQFERVDWESIGRTVGAVTPTVRQLIRDTQLAEQEENRRCACDHCAFGLSPG
jgi:hypothetical protein